MTLMYDTESDLLLLVSGPHLYPVSMCLFGGASLVDSFYVVENGLNKSRYTTEQYLRICSTFEYIGDL